MEIKIDIWKNGGKWYTTEEALVESTDEIDSLMNNYPKCSGMIATVYYYVEKEAYYQPYRMFQL